MKNIRKILEATKKLSPQEIDEAIEKAPSPESDVVWTSLVSMGALTEHDVFQALADVNKIRFIDKVKSLDLKADVISLVSAQMCRDESLVPLIMRDNIIFIGTDNPNNLEAFDQIASMTGKQVIVNVITATDRANILNRFFRQDNEIGELSEQLQEDSEEIESASEDMSDDEGESPVVRFANLVIMQAIRDSASDIHVEPTEKQLVIRYRIDGVLHVVQRADKAIQRGVISRLKVMSSIDIAEKRVPQDGRMTVRSSGRKVDIRVTTLPSVWGEKIVMRILDSSATFSSVSSMNMSKKNEAKFRKAIVKPHGLVLITGPTGSGKTSTLLTVLNEVSNDSISVVTVEEPVEKRVPGVTQIEVNVKAGLTFPRALRNILRADPDIVMIGEVRDDETAKMAIDASMTGHLVLATLHTNGAPEAPSRLIEMGVEPYLVGSSISLVVAQRLARRLCNDCKKPVELDKNFLDDAEFPESMRAIGFFEPVGCGSCASTGFKGRIALTEVLEMDDDIEKMILAGRSSREIRNFAEGKNFDSLRYDGYEKVALGITTIAEVMRVTVV